MGAFSHGFAAFQNDGPEAHLRQQQRGKDAARAKTHHHRALRQVSWGLSNRLIGHIGCRPDVRFAGQAAQGIGFNGQAGQRHIHDVNHQQLGLAGVVAAFENLQLPHIRRGDAQGLAGFGGQVFGGMVKRELELGQADHVGRLQGLW